MGFNFEVLCASIFTVFCIILAKLYSMLNRPYFYWDKKNVTSPKATYIIGTWEKFYEKFLGKEDCNNTARLGKVYGTYDGMTPNLVVTDPEIIREVLETSADKFQDLRFASENSVVLKDSLLSLCGGEKSQVQMLTNSLLSPHKLEKLIPRLESSAEILIHNITKERQEDDRLNITSSVTDFIYEVIALTVFGIELNADIEFKDDFVKHCRQIFNVQNPRSFMSVMPCFYPSIFKEQWIFPEKSLQYFVNLIISGISGSSGEVTFNEGKPSDLIRLVVEASQEEKNLVKKEKEEESEELVLTDNVIISKCIASMLTLVNATRTTVILGIYALANNEEVQERLFKEIEKNKSEKLCYEDIQNLNYLDKVVKEIMRLYPFEFRLEKVCTENVKIGEVEVEKKNRVSIPLYALHRSTELYPEPEEFDPERFSQSASEKRSPFTYLPFGQAGVNGSDISLHLGVLASKVTLLRLVEKFKFSDAPLTSLQHLFEKGFTRVPKPEKIELKAKSRILNEKSETSEPNLM